MYFTSKNNHINDLLHWAEKQLSPIVENPEHEAKWLLSAMLECKITDLQFSGIIVSAKQIRKFEQWIERRFAGEPAQYISGWTEFYGRPFNVNTDVLIPRPETERLVETAIHSFKKLNNPQLIDIGTGSGCIAISVAAELPQANLLGIDISPDTLKTAKANAELNSIHNISFINQDFFHFIPQIPRFDGLLMNPPYIPEIEMKFLMKEVLDYEPALALTDKKDGLLFYRHISMHAKSWVFPGGYLIMEVGLGDHPQNVASLFRTNAFDNLEFIADYNGDTRILKVQLK